MRWLCVAVCFALACAVAGVPAGTQAQDKSSRAAAKGGSGTKATAKRTKKAKRATAKDKDRNAPVRSASTDKPAESAPATPAPDTSGGHTPSSPSEDAAALAADADERVRKEDGEEIKTVEFGGLDIEGQLKTPQMLYFLNRLRAEFSRPELPHRSFIPELQRGTQENGF
jgi:hypothetical protein